VTEYEFEVQMLTTYGWECVTTEATRAEAIAQRDTYRANDPDNAYRYKRVVAS
jgi:hypothetical protein